MDLAGCRNGCVSSVFIALLGFTQICQISCLIILNSVRFVCELLGV